MSGFKGLFLTPFVSHIVEGRRLNWQGAYVCVDHLCRPTARFAWLLRLPLLRLFQNHTIDIGLRELALLLLAWRAALNPRCDAQVGSRRRFADPAVIALSLDHLRDLKHVTQPLMLNNRALVNFGQPVVLFA